MSFSQKVPSTYGPPRRILFAAHITFINYDYDAPLSELSETFDIPKDDIEVLEVSLYERVFALWIYRPDMYQSHMAIKSLIQRLEGIYGVRKCILQQQSIYFVNSAGTSTKPSSLLPHKIESLLFSIHIKRDIDR